MPFFNNLENVEPRNILITYYPDYLADSLKAFLENLGYNVYLCPDFDTMLTVEPFDLACAIVDISTEGPSPIHTIEMIKQYEFGHDVPVLVVTDTPSTPRIVEALNAGAMDYIIRPFSKLELSQRIRSILNR